MLIVTQHRAQERNCVLTLTQSCTCARTLCGCEHAVRGSSWGSSVLCCLQLTSMLLLSVSCVFSAPAVRNECETIAQGVKYRPRKKQHCLRLRQKCMQQVVLLGAVPFSMNKRHGLKLSLSSNKP